MSYTKTAFTLTNVTEALTQIKLLVRWINQELQKIEEESKLPQLQGIQFEYLYAPPTKYAEGDLYYFAEGVAGAPGLFIRDSNGWRKL